MLVYLLFISKYIDHKIWLFLYKFLFNYHTANLSEIPPYVIPFVSFSSLYIRQKAFVAVIAAYIAVHTLTMDNGKHFMEYSIISLRRIRHR